MSILKKCHHWFALFLYSVLSTCVWPWLRGVAEPGGLPVSALQIEVGQHLAPLSSQGQDATGGLYLHCLGLAPLQHIYHGMGWLGGASWSAPKSQGMMQNCTGESRVGCLSAPPGVLLWSCAVVLRIIFLGSSSFRKQFIQGSNPTRRQWIPRYNACLKKSLLGDCTVATCLPHWHRLPQPSLLPRVRERIWAKVVIFPEEVLLQLEVLSVSTRPGFDILNWKWVGWELNFFSYPLRLSTG